MINSYYLNYNELYGDIPFLLNLLYPTGSNGMKWHIDNLNYDGKKLSQRTFTASIVLNKNFGLATAPHFAKSYFTSDRYILVFLYGIK